ncbi:hypothetical protein V6N11_052079 [Hibiscus sabdariffa]|uniref:Uncharacterized protein n=1 Tax=Hibiscus sabdariffa TaxID=183260 RepID=A0ABR2U928_9ROSI
MHGLGCFHSTHEAELSRGEVHTEQFCISISERYVVEDLSFENMDLLLPFAITHRKQRSIETGMSIGNGDKIMFLAIDSHSL